MRQPAAVLCVQDLSCVGRCSLGTAAPVLSAMGAQCCMLPTAVLSTHYGGFGAPAQLAGTAFANAALAHYAALGLQFACVQSGYLAGAAQTQLVQRAFAQNPGALKVADPALGDHGKAYSAVDADMIDAMRTLCRAADVLTPNVTESALLLGLALAEVPLSPKEVCARLAALWQRFDADIVLTGVRLANGVHANACLVKGGAPVLLPYAATAAAYPGTGDLFCAALTGGLLRGESLAAATGAAADFIAAAAKAMPPEADTRFGLWFEPFLPLLMKK